MTIKQCDKCKTTIDGWPMTILFDFKKVELCKPCAQLIIEFLNKNELLEKSEFQIMQGKIEAIS